jgi:hypothetical protein
MFYKNIMLAILCSIIPCTVSADQKNKQEKQEETYIELAYQNWKPIALGAGIATTIGAVTYLALQHNTALAPATTSTPLPITAHSILQNTMQGVHKHIESMQNAIKKVIVEAPEKGKSIHELKESLSQISTTPINGLTIQEKSVDLKNKIKDAYTSFVQKCKDVLARKETQDNLNAVKTSILAGVDKVIHTSKSFAHAAWGFTDNPKPSPVLEAARKKAMYINLLKEAQTAQDQANKAWDKASECFKKL